MSLDSCRGACGDQNQNYIHMKKPKTIFYLVYFLFHVLLLAVSIYVNYKSEDFEFLLKLRANMSLMTYVSVAGLILFGVNMILVYMEARNFSHTKKKLEGEVNSWKAKLYDLKEAGDAKSKESTSADTTNEDSSDKSAED